MKKINILLPIIGLMLVCAQVAAQTNVNMAVTGATGSSPFTIAPSSACSFHFFDNGGPAGNYVNNSDAYVTFAPSNPATHRIRVNFSSFQVEANWDALYIFNSNAVGVNPIAGPEGATISGFPAGNWQTISPGIVTANTGVAAVGSNPAEALTFQFRSDGSNPAPGWSAIVNQVPKDACTLNIPSDLTAHTGPGATSAFVNISTPVPVYLPGGCEVSYKLQYRLNGGAPTSAPLGGFVSIAAPKGNNIVTWELTDPCGGAVVAAAAQSIAIVDDTPPVITCPGDITINLDPGQCSKQYSYNVTCTDNAGLSVPGEVAHPIDFDNGSAGIMFDVKNIGFTTITLTEFGPSIDAGNWPIQVYYTSSTWQGKENNAAAWTMAGSLNVVSAGPGAGTPVPGFGITLAPGETKGIYLTSTIGAPINYTGNGVSVTRQFDDGKLLVSSNPGAGKTYPFGNTFQSRAYNGYVKYEAVGTQTALQTGGLPPGSEFPIGTTINTFICTDAEGNTAACSFKVTVVEFSNSITSLICNDLVFIALGPDCQTTLNADQVLEGGAYGCYNDYLVELDKVPPFGNGPWVPAVLSAADLGKTYRVRVTDPVTGNKCFGDIKVQDNLPPSLDCTPVTLPGNYPTDPTFKKVTSAFVRFGVQDLPLNVVDFQTREFQIPVSLPAGATVNDVDFRVKVTGDGFFGNLRMQVESPAGIIVNTWNQVSGCAGDPIFARFDDEGSNTVTCPFFSTDKNIQIPFGVGALSTFDGQQVNGIWKIRISDVNAGGDISKVEVAELYFNVTGNFTVGFPNGLTAPPLTSNGPNSWHVPPSLLDACSDVTLSFIDQTTPQDCASGLISIISRRWTAKDASGNTATCIQPIYLLRPTLADVSFPPNYDDIDLPSFDCQSVYPSPDWLESQGFQGFPYVYGLPNSTSSLNWTYNDNIIKVCDGSYNVRRTWTVVDVCSSQSVEHLQIIQVRDKVGPEIECPANVTATTDPYSCCSTVNLPDVIVSDVCSRINNIKAEISIIDPTTQTIEDIKIVNGTLATFPGNNPANPDTLAVFGNSTCLPIGEHIVTYIAQDDCGNTSSCSFTLKVSDYSPPSAICTEFTVVAIGPDDPNDCYLPSANGCEFAGVTYVPATSFDAGSYDNCNNIKLMVRRTAPYTPFIQSLNPVNGQPNCSDNSEDAVTEFERATIEDDTIKFYCGEVGTSQMIILRVYQLEPDGSISLLPDGTPIFNECQIEVEVQDKLKPICESPLNVTVSCENFDPSLWAYGKPGVYDNCCLDSTKMYMGQKGLTHSVNYAQFDSTCNKGTIVRTFRAYDCKGAFTQCTQRIVVEYEQGYFIKFPNDVVVTQCNGSGLYGEPQISGKDCELLGISFEDQVYTVVPDACFKIERTWKIINWCTYIPQANCINVPNPNPNANLASADNLPGPTVSAPGTPAPWAPTVVKILPTDQTATNYSTFWNADANCYQYKQIIKIIDNEKPVVLCPPSPVEFCDMTTNDNLLWNETYWFDPVSQSHDLCEAPTDLNISATDLCSGANLDIRYLLFLDLDQNGSMETVVSSTNPPDANTVLFNNANSPNFATGTPRAFDKRNVPLGQKYKFAIDTKIDGSNMTAAVRWNTLQSPSSFTVPELPYGTHKIKWIIGDGCGNETVCEYTFVVKDCKPPTVTCINGLSVNIMQSGMIMLFASDFLLHGQDNCTPEDLLTFGISHEEVSPNFPTDPVTGLPVTQVTFDCSELGNQSIELWVMDQAGNASYCEASIQIQDNFFNCNNATTATVAGALKTESGDGLEECDVELSGQDPGGSTFHHFGMTDADGQFHFNSAVPLNSNYTLTPTKDDNPLNGVSTYDLVLISKHILGLQPFDSPFKMIAADANRSGSITTFDVVEFRKLILGIYDELPNNTSWRFVDKGFTFPNQANPFQTAFPETKSVAGADASAMGEDFTAIKVGDVNGTAIANALMNLDDRSASTLLFDVEDKTVKVGEEVVVTFRAAEKVAGYQFTMNFNELKVMDILPGDDMKAENFAIFPDEKALTTSWNASQPGGGQAEFSVKFKAKKAGKLSEMLTVSSRITYAEAYQDVDAGEEMSSMDVAFRFNGEQGSTVTGVGFELYQNQPNPFVNRTTIGFHLPEATEATLSVFDESGRLLYTQTGDFSKGYNAVMLDRSMLKTNGLLYYKLETANESATRKMILLK